jgi:hypothetical protein
MPLILVGYGDYFEYRLGELPVEAIEELARRYPLEIAEQSSPDFDDLAITVAIHAEMARRRGRGVKPDQHIPSRRQLAQTIVTKGFQQASKQYHPDCVGHHEAQVRLGNVRDELLENCQNIADDRPEGAIMIPPPPAKRPVPVRRPAADPFSNEGISDDDVPF